MNKNTLGKGLIDCWVVFRIKVRKNQVNFISVFVVAVGTVFNVAVVVVLAINEVTLTS